MKILKHIQNLCPHLSRKQIQNLIKEGHVLINHKAARLVDVVQDSDQVTIDPQFLVNSLQPNSQVGCDLIYEDENLIFLDKPIHVHSVAHSFTETHTVANWLLSLDTNLSQVSDPLESGLLHRLDYETSGIMLAAKNRESFEILKDHWQSHFITKEYMCIVTQQPPSKGIYTSYASSISSKKIQVSDLQVDTSDKSIQTQILASEKIQEGLWELKVQLITGFRHQIRAHLAFLGCPILGDALYGGKKHKRLMLHATRIAFEMDGKKISQSSLKNFHIS